MITRVSYLLANRSRLASGERPLEGFELSILARSGGLGRGQFDTCDAERPNWGDQPWDEDSYVVYRLDDYDYESRGYSKVGKTSFDVAKQRARSLSATDAMLRVRHIERDVAKIRRGLIAAAAAAVAGVVALGVSELSSMANDVQDNLHITGVVVPGQELDPLSGVARAISAATNTVSPSAVAAL